MMMKPFLFDITYDLSLNGKTIYQSTDGLQMNYIEIKDLFGLFEDATDANRNVIVQNGNVVPRVDENGGRYILSTTLDSFIYLEEEIMIRTNRSIPPDCRFVRQRIYKILGGGDNCKYVYADGNLWKVRNNWKIYYFFG